MKKAVVIVIGLLVLHRWTVICVRAGYELAVADKGESHE